MSESPPGNRIWTVPNALSVLRLLGVPRVPLPAARAPRRPVGAADPGAVGRHRLARRGPGPALDQTSRFGALLDPLADRLYILATLVGLVLRHVIPLWLAVVIVGRDALLAVTLPLLRRAGYGPPEVHYLGKAATFCLLYAFPLLLLGTYHGPAADVARAIAWAFTIWGTVLYLLAGAVYLKQAAGLVRHPVRAPERSEDAR